MAYTFTRTGAQIEEIHNTVEDPKSNAQFSDDIRAIAGEYRGLWPDTGGSANKGDTYQTQVDGTPTGQYFTALQNTTVDPVGDDVNWRAVVSFSSISGENLISNAFFEIAGSVTNQPDTTARDYNAGDELFQGAFAVGALTGVTYVNGELSGTGQLYTDVYKSEKQKLSTANYVASTAPGSGLPDDSGASFVDNGDYWRVTFDMSSTFSVKLEQGSVATRHDVAGGNFDNFVKVSDYYVNDIGETLNSLSMNHSRIMIDKMPMPYEMSTQFDIPDGLTIRSDGANIKRKTGSGAFDMFYAENKNIYIYGYINIDGNKDADGLVKENPSDRFSGFRFIGCSGFVSKLRADNTVNGEIQTEGVRAGIIIDSSPDLVSEWLHTDNTDGTGVFAYETSGRIAHVRTSNSAFSGFSSVRCADGDFHDIYSDTSGFSGVSVNGPRLRASKLYGKNAANGYANVNIGHNNPMNDASDSQISQVRSEDSNGWGVTIAGTNGAIISEISSSGSENEDIRIFDGSDNISLSGLISRNGASVGLNILSGNNHTLSDSEIKNHQSSGIACAAGTSLIIAETVKVLSNCQASLPNTANILANGANIKCSARNFGSGVDNFISSGSAGVISIDGGSSIAPTGEHFKTLSGGTFDFSSTRLSNSDSLSSTFVVAAGTNVTQTVNNSNVITASKIKVTPISPQAAALQNFYISNVVQGVSFDVVFNGASTGAETFAYDLT